jgi:YVTN family beta-propeller protein
MRNVWLLIWFLLFTACKYEKGVGELSDYPEEVAKIMRTSCATSGCHNAQSNANAAGLDLSSWASMMQGSRTGAAVVPYSVSESFLLQFVNTYPDLGLSQQPVMPPNASALTRAQVQTLRNWIQSGAPNASGEVAFTGITGRKKAYVVNQGCDLLSVIDVQTGLLIRSISIGTQTSVVESPHNVRIRPDGKYGYIVFLNAPFIQYFDTETDQIIGQIDIGYGQWNTIVFSPDGKYAYAADFDPNGKIACVRLDQHILYQMYQGSGFLINPHGQWVSPDNKTLWVAPQTGNFLYRLDVTDPRNPSKLAPVVLDGTGNPQTGTSLNPHELLGSPDGKYIFITCEHSNDIRVVDQQTLEVVKVIPVGVFPQEMALSHDPALPYLFVTCMEDTLTYPGAGRGSVWAINMNTLSVAYHFYAGFQPHGIDVSSTLSEVWVANRNVSPGGMAPHHSTECSGNSGYVNRFRISDGKQVNVYPIWLSVDPYGLVFR